MTAEGKNLVELERWLAPAFEVFREVPLRHALFRRRSMRVDLLAIPKDEKFSDIALGFEVKGHEIWDIPKLSGTLKQAADYVLASVEFGATPVQHIGKRVMAVFIWPTWHSHQGPEHRNYDEGVLVGLRHMASYFRVGSAYVTDAYREKPFALTIAGEIWLSSRGWRSDARNILAGKRQIGSQRFPILEELNAMAP